MKKAYFISDLHLGAKYIADKRAHEKKVCDFLVSVSDDMSQLFLVGDILDYWFEYKTVVPRGFIRFFGTLAFLADKGVEIVWLTGNHDIWLFDYLEKEIGLTVVDGDYKTKIFNSNFYIAHGDAVPPLKKSFRFIRWLFRNKIAQKLYSGIHPRWTIPFAHLWSSHSRKNGGYVSPRIETPELDPLVVFARNYNREHTRERADFFIFGHRHEIFEYEDKKNFDATVAVIGDWITNFSYATFDGEKLKIEQFGGKM